MGVGAGEGVEEAEGGVGGEEVVGWSPSGSPPVMGSSAGASSDWNPVLFFEVGEEEGKGLEREEAGKGEG